MNDQTPPPRARKKVSKLRYRLEQVFIAFIHLFLLSWMVATLKEAGSWPFVKVMLHFTGMAFYGGFLIYGTAMWAKRRM